MKHSDIKMYRFLTLLAHWANVCERNKEWTAEDEQVYRQISDIISKSLRSRDKNVVNNEIDCYSHPENPPYTADE